MQGGQLIDLPAVIMNTQQSVSVKINHEECSVIGNIDVLYSLLGTNEKPPMLPLREERRTDGIELVYNDTKESHHKMVEGYRSEKYSYLTKLGGSFSSYGGTSRSDYRSNRNKVSKPCKRGKDIIFRSNYHTSAMSYDAYLEFLEQRHKQIMRTTQGHSAQENRAYESTSRSIGSQQDSNDDGYSIYCMINSSNSVMSEMTASVSTEYHKKLKKENVDILYSILGTKIPTKLPLQKERRSNGVQIVHCEKGINHETVRDQKLVKKASLVNDIERQRSSVNHEQSKKGNSCINRRGSGMTEFRDEGDTCYVNNSNSSGRDEGVSSLNSLQALLSITESSGLVDKYSQLHHNNSYSFFEEDYDIKENVKFIDKGSHESGMKFENDMHLTLEKNSLNGPAKIGEPSDRVSSKDTRESFDQHSPPNNKNAKIVSESLFAYDVGCRQVNERMYSISVDSNDLVEELIEYSTNQNLDLILSEDDISQKRIESSHQHHSTSGDRIESDDEAVCNENLHISDKNVKRRENDDKENYKTIDKRCMFASRTKVPLSLKSGTKNIIQVQDHNKAILGSERSAIQEEIVRFDLFEPKMHFLLY